MEDLLRILIVDDDEVDRMSVRRALRAAGVRAEVHEAEDVATALRALGEETLDCVFLDYNLPGGDGLRVLRSAREAGMDTPVVMLTGHEDTQTAVELMKAGASDYLSKNTLTPERLERSLRTAVRLHRAERQARGAEDALRLSEERYRSLVAASAQAVWTVGPDGLVEDDLPGWRAFTGQTPEEVRGWGWLDAIHPDDRERTARTWSAAVAGRTEYDIEHRVRRYDGEYRYMTARGVPVLNPDGSVREWVGAHTDITLRRRAEEEREAAIQARSRFYAAMSHELRTPINAVIGYNDLLLAGVYGPLGEPKKQGIERSQRAAKHLLELVNDVLDLSKLEAGKIEVEMEEVRIPALIDDLFVTIRPLAEEHGYELLLENEPCADTLRTDPRRVRQILLNLLSNAIKFGEGKPIRVRCAGIPGQGLRVEVIDRGRGIAPEDQARIFEEFVQVAGSAANPTGQSGTGLGLSISRRLAELLGGWLEVESTLREGSTFRLTLPPRPPER